VGSLRRQLIQLKFNHVILTIALERVFHDIKNSVLLLLVQFSDIRLNELLVSC
jgi:hypothetical protein